MLYYVQNTLKKGDYNSESLNCYSYLLVTMEDRCLNGYIYRPNSAYPINWDINPCFTLASDPFSSHYLRGRLIY